MIALGNQEIGNHSTTHPCSINFRPGAKGLEGMTLEELGRDLDKANEEIRRMTGLTPVSFAYPCGQSTVGRGEGVQSYVPLIAKRFTSGRGYYDEMGNYPFVCDFAKLLGLATDDMDFAGMKRLIETARNSSRWVIFCGHEIGPRKFQSTEAEALRALADYVNDPANGVWVDTVGNITSHVRKLQGV
jgi:peptidoglycan/xylan/chitin deacetylase (PgdA/CDA1 family)